MSDFQNLVVENPWAAGTMDDADMVAGLDAQSGRMRLYSPSAAGSNLFYAAQRAQKMYWATDPTWGATPGISRAAMLTALTALWTDALADGADMHFPAGVYEIGEANMPWRQSIVTDLLDCGDITIHGEGPATIFRTASVGGADVFQLNGLKNFHLRDFAIEAELLSGAASAGSNGISVTNGWDNITALDIFITNLASLDKTTHIDGGKALTFQPPASGGPECGTFKARIFVKGCSEGVGFEPNLVNIATKKTAIDVDIVAEDCYAAVKSVAGAASGPLTAGMSSGVRVRGQAINCQKDVVLNRAHGIDVDIQVITTKTAAARRLSPSGVAWFAPDTIVESLHCFYAKNSRIVVQGDKGACDYKARIGGATAGSSGLNGATEFCDITLDLGGTAAVSALAEIDSGGNTVRESTIYITPGTAASFPAQTLLPGNANTLVRGPTLRLVRPQFAGRVSLNTGADGSTEFGALDVFNSAITALQGKFTSGATATVAGLADINGVVRFGIVNSQGIAIDSLNSVAALGAYVGKHPVYDAAGTLIGYFPVYA